MSDFDAYRTPAATSETPNLLGDDLMLARAVAAMYYGTLLYLVCLLTSLAPIVAEGAALSDGVVTTIEWIRRALYAVCFLVDALGGFFLVMSNASAWLRTLGWVVLVGFLWGTIQPHQEESRQRELIAEIIYGMPIPLGSTARALAIMALVPNNSAVQRAAVANIGLTWLVNSCDYWSLPTGQPPFLTLSILVLILLVWIGDGICDWLAIGWAREELLRPPNLPSGEGILFEPQATATPADR